MKFRKKAANNQRSSLVGGFNPIEKYESNWMISPGRGENSKNLKPPKEQTYEVISLTGK